MLVTSHRLSNNNFDLLRFIFSLTVCVVHIYTLSGFEQLLFLTEILSSDIAVKSFFVVSGFLIFMSYERSYSIKKYFKNRILRIYPAYFFVVAICSIGLFILSSKSLHEYFSSSWVKYMIWNLSFMNFLQPSLPGVFDDNRFQAVNGALWTLKIEVLFYLLVPILVWLFRRIGYMRGIVIAYLLSVIYTLICTKLAQKTSLDFYNILGRQFPGQLAYFMAGAFFYYSISFFKRWSYIYLAIATLIFYSDLHLTIPLIEPLTIAIFVCFFALHLYLGNFGKFGDFSYGIYIIHFPVIQCFIHGKWLINSPWLFLSAVLAVTMLLSIALWHLLEKHFLSRNNHYITQMTSNSTQ